VGSTELSTRLDAEDLRNVVGAYRRSVADTSHSGVARIGSERQ
jgi:hypothetical protein